jgi:hypothetical protein
MTRQRRALRGSLWLLLCFGAPGCSSPEQAPPAVVKPAQNQPSSQTEVQEERLRTLLAQARGLPEKTPFQLAAKAKLLRLLGTAQAESTRKNPLEGAIPAAALQRITQTLDEVEAGIAAYPAD